MLPWLPGPLTAAGNACGWVAREGATRAMSSVAAVRACRAGPASCQHPGIALHCVLKKEAGTRMRTGSMQVAIGCADWLSLTWWHKLSVPPRQGQGKGGSFRLPFTASQTHVGVGVEGPSCSLPGRTARGLGEGTVPTPPPVATSLPRCVRRPAGARALIKPGRPPSCQGRADRRGCIVPPWARAGTGTGTRAASAPPAHTLPSSRWTRRAAVS